MAILASSSARSRTDPTGIVAVAVSGGPSVSGGGAVQLDQLGHPTTTAAISGSSTVTASAAVTVTAQDTSTITAKVTAVLLRGRVGFAGLAVGGSTAHNTIAGSVTAKITGSVVTAQNGNITISAAALDHRDHQHLDLNFHLAHRRSQRRLDETIETINRRLGLRRRLDPHRLGVGSIVDIDATSTADFGSVDQARRRGLDGLAFSA